MPSLTARPSTSRIVRMCRRGRQFWSVSDQRQGLPGAVEIPQELADLVAGGGLHHVGRLVGQQHVRGVDQGPAPWSAGPRREIPSKRQRSDDLPGSVKTSTRSVITTGPLAAMLMTRKSMLSIPGRPGRINVAIVFSMSSIPATGFSGMLW